MQFPEKILIVTRNLPPLVGGMERLNWHMADELSKYAETHVIGPGEAERMKPENVGFSGIPLKPLWRFLLHAGWQAICKARKWKPDVILAGSGLTAPIALLAARLYGARAVAYVHGLDISVNHPVYRTLWLPAIRRLDRVIANSSPTAELAEKAGVAKERIGIVHPGVKLPERPQTQETIDHFLQENRLNGKKILLSVGRLTSRKGLREFVQLALPIIISREPDAILVVVGDAPTDSLHAEIQTPQSIQAVADAVGVGEHLRFLGVITDPAKLATAYQASSVHIFPVRHIPGDPEGFGMVAIEAAAHGLPTVAFATGGVVDAVKSGVSGELTHPGDYEQLANLACQILTAPPIAEGMSTFVHNLSWESFGDQIYQQFTKSAAAE